MRPESFEKGMTPMNLMNRAWMIAFLMILSSLSGCLGDDEITEEQKQAIEDVAPGNTGIPQSNDTLISGCVYESATNYDATATHDDGSCEFDADGDGVIDADEVEGCTDSSANNYNSTATDDDDSCDYDDDDDGVNDADEVDGCTDESANNHDQAATEDDGSCDYDADDDGIADRNEIAGCMNQAAINFDQEATDDDGTCMYDNTVDDNSSGENASEPSVNITLHSVSFSGVGEDKSTWILISMIHGSDAESWQNHIEVTITVNGSDAFPGQDVNNPYNITINLPNNLEHNHTYSWRFKAITKDDSTTILDVSGSITTPESPHHGQKTYDSNDLSEFWLDFFFCQTSDGSPVVDDLTTSQTDTLQCENTVALNETHIIISSNGIPNHDFESTLACSEAGDCTSEQDYTWSIPRSPTNDTTGGHNSVNCPEANGDYECASDRGSIAVAMNGVPMFGPEDGPGGDAVATHHGAYDEDRQAIELGVCHGHAAQGGTYHYHADANCMHWHPEDGENIKDGYDNSAPDKVAPNTYDGNHSKVIGVAFDGYPIYGFWGYDDNMNVVEMKSSYELKDGETGYNGIDDYQYTEGLGHLDVCNGYFGPTPDFPQGIYHYHTTMQNGDGDMGFPYFLICYHGEADMSSDAGGGQGGGDCDGFGETWGPGIGPPPPGCENGGGPPPNGVVSSSSASPFSPAESPLLPLLMAQRNEEITRVESEIVEEVQRLQ